MKQDNELEVNAYVDGELSTDQQAEFLEAMRKDPELARRACELNQMKAQLRLSYTEPPRSKTHVGSAVKASWRALVASVVLLAVGVISGWLLHAKTGSTSIDHARFVVLDPDGRGQAPAVASDGETRIVFHLTNPDQTIAGELLDEVEGLLAAYQADDRLLRVEVVSHSDGLVLLRERLSQHKNRIGELAGRFSNLTFVACQNSIDRIKVEHGIEVKLLPDAEVIDSGVDHVVKRQREGWSYIRV